MSKQNAVQKFFAALAEKDLEKALEEVHGEAGFSAPRPDTVAIYSDFHGKDGVIRFIEILGDLYDTEVFKIYDVRESEDYVFSIGFLKHGVKKTGRIFECEWSLVCRINDGKIIFYKMFEDTSSLEKAYLDL